MLDIFTKFFLIFSHDTMIIPIIIGGFIWSNRNVFYHAICLVLLSILLSFILKLIFQKQSMYGLAFPSGHMQASVVLYGWLAYTSRNYFLRILTTILLIGIGFSLVYLGYHDYYDVLGGVFFAIILLAGYSFTLNKMTSKMPYINLSLATYLMLSIFFYCESILPHLWLAYYALLGFIISTKIFKQDIELKTITEKTLTSLFCLLAIISIKSIFQLQILSGLPTYLSQLQWLLIGFIVPLSSSITRIRI